MAIQSRLVKNKEATTSLRRTTIGGKEEWEGKEEENY
jgi:hypothetical protein